MPITAKITLSTIGTSNGNFFDLYSDVDNYTTPFEYNIPKASLSTGYTSTVIPDYTCLVKVKSTTGGCDLEPLNGIEIPNIQFYTSGLVVYYDARNLISYPKTGVTWNSIIGPVPSNWKMTGFSNAFSYDSANSGSLYFSGGTNSYIATNGTLFTNDDASHSIGGWVKIVNNGQAGTYYSRGGGFSQSPGWSLRISKGTDDKISFDVVTGYKCGNILGTEGVSLVYDTPISDGWHYIMGVWDKNFTTCVKNLMKLYIDGNLVSFRSNTNVRLFGSKIFSVAKGLGHLSATTPIESTYSDFEVYQSALTTPQVKTNFFNRKSTFGLNYVQNSKIEVNFEFNVNNSNIGYMDIYSGTTDNVFEKVYTLNTNGSYFDMILNPGEKFYTYIYDFQYVGTDGAQIAIYKNGTNITTTDYPNFLTPSTGYTALYTVAINDSWLVRGVSGQKFLPSPDVPPTPTPTATPTPTPGGPTPTPTPLPLPSGSLFFYDPGNIASYPGSGSILYDLSGNGRHANINTGITWVSGSAAYFDLNGNDNNSITGTTLSQTLTSWSMWIGIQRDSIGDYDGFMSERSGASNVNGLGAFSTSNRLTVSANNNLDIIEAEPGRLVTGSWMFLGGSVDNTTYTSMVYKSGSINTFITGSKVTGSSNFNDPIVLGEDKETGVDRTLDGRVGPALMYDRKLTTSELTQINDYFKTRYGI